MAEQESARNTDADRHSPGVPIRIAVGETSPLVIEVRQHLSNVGFLDAGNGHSDYYDSSTADAVANFRAFYQLPGGTAIDEYLLDLVRTPRCGVADLQSEGWLDPWPTIHLRYSIANTVPRITQEHFNAAFGQALEVWRSAVPFVFTHVPTSSAAELRVLSGRGDHCPSGDFDGPWGTLAHAFAPPPPATDLAGDIHFDADESWSIADPTPAGSIDLISVAAHEIGHALGLPHSTDRSDLMYAYYSGQHRSLSEGDVRRIQGVYGVVGDPLTPVDSRDSARFRESSHQFVCPVGCVMIGRMHNGDENGATYYRYARLRRGSDGATATLENVAWSAWKKESSSTFVAPPNRVVVGREHRGDENGSTRYLTATVRVGATVALVGSSREGRGLSESSGEWFVAPDGAVIVGRRHQGDENGSTWYRYSFVSTA